MSTRRVIITAALTGGKHGKDANPNLPEQPKEIAQAAYDCWQAGAAIAHLHARDPDGRVTGDPIIYRRIHRLIRERCPLILQDTTGGGPGLPREEAIRVLEAKPEMASLNMGTMVHTGGDEDIWVNRRSQIEDFARRMLDTNVKPEMEVYGQPMMIEVLNLVEKGLIRPPYYLNFVLGLPYQNALPGEPRHLLSLIDYLPEGAIFNVTGIGRTQLPLTMLSILLGGNARVGLEDSVYLAKGQLATSNAQLVERTVKHILELGLEVASPSAAREILGLTSVQDTDKSD